MKSTLTGNRMFDVCLSGTAGGAPRKAGGTHAQHAPLELFSTISSTVSSVMGLGQACANVVLPPT